MVDESDPIRGMTSGVDDTSAMPMEIRVDGTGGSQAFSAMRSLGSTSASDIAAEFSSKFMRLTMEYVVNFPAAANIGVDVATELAGFTEKIGEAEGQGDVVTMLDVMEDVGRLEAMLEAKKRAFDAGEDPADVNVASGPDLSVRPQAAYPLAGAATDRLERVQPMSPAEKQLVQDEDEVQRRLAKMQSPSQEDRMQVALGVKFTQADVDSGATPMVTAGGQMPQPIAEMDDRKSESMHKFKPEPTRTGPPASDRNKDIINIDDDEDRPMDMDEREDETTYAKYIAAGVRKLHPNVREHPDPLVETASLRSVPMPALDFQHCLQEEVDNGVLSDAQLETVIYANMRYNQPVRPRMGFFLGDGAGVGKGRQIAALCKQHWHDGGRCILWVSVSQDLRIDTKRDLKDVNAAHIPVHSNGSPPKGFSGVVFCTYAFLRMGLAKMSKKQEGQQGHDQRDEEKIDRLTEVPESSNIGKLIKWLSECPEGSLIVLDESHKAKNLLPSKGGGPPTQTGRAIMFLQERLPDAKLLYSSATGASEPRNLAYMHRLGIGGVGNTEALVQMLTQSNTDALELAAMSLKSAGAYLGRTLSYDGAEFDLVRVKLERSFNIMYDRGSEIWTCLYNVAQAFSCPRWQGKFWGAHQRFFKSMLMAGKVPEITKMAKEALLNDMCVVIGLQSTGESATQQAMSRMATDEMTDLISAPRLALTKCVQLMVKYDTTIQSLDDDMKRQDLEYTPARGYADCDRLRNILAVHKETFYLAKKIMDQPSIAEIEAEMPEETQTDVSPDAVGQKLDDLMSQLTELTNAKNRANLEMIACKDAAEKSNLRVRVEALEQQASDISSSISRLRAMKAELDGGGGYFSRRSSSSGRPQGVIAPKVIEPPTALLEEYRTPDPTSDRMEGYTTDDVHILCHQIIEWYDFIADKIDLPANPLDDLIHNLGGQDKVAELTGRKGGIFFDEDGVAEYRNRKADDSQFRKKDVNLFEKNLFMEGKKLVAIISDASSTGISLQADRRVKNQRRRCHITLELPWSADKAIQQFGRSHRANQTSAPIYKMVVTPCGGEYRFACAASKRLASLGALLRGDRNALGAGSDLKSFDIDSELGKRTLKKFLLSFLTKRLPQGGKGIQERQLPLHMAMDLEDFQRLSPNERFLNYFYERLQLLGLKFKAGKLDCTVPTFLNRLLGFRIEEQDILFRYFSDVMELERELMINEGLLERGIVSMDVVAKLKETHVVHTNEQTQSKVFHHVVLTDRGKSWEYVKEKLSEVLRVFGGISAVSRHSGFYVQRDIHSGKDKMWNLNGEKVPKIKLVTVIPDEAAMDGDYMQHMKAFTIHPYSEHPQKSRLTDTIGPTQRKLSFDEAIVAWKKWYDYLDTGCIHGDNCKHRKEGNECLGRHAELHLLTGGLLEFFTRLHEISKCSDFIGRVYYVNKADKSHKRRHPLEIVRVIVDTGEPVVGYKAVSEAEMAFFKYQMLLPPGHEDDIVVKKLGTIHKDKAEERKRKEQENAKKYSTQKKYKQPAAQQRNIQLKQDAQRAMVSNPQYIADLERVARCSRGEAIQALRNAGGRFSEALMSFRS